MTSTRFCYTPTIQPRLRLAGSGPTTIHERDMEAICRRHGHALHRYVLSLTFGDQHLAEDIVQETFLRAWRSPELVTDGQESCRGWLTTVARNLVIDRLRKRGRRPQEAGDEALPHVVEPTCGIDRALVSITLREAMAKLTPARRQILVEMYYRERSLNEVAKTLGIPVGTVKSRAHYALRALRNELAGAGAHAERLAA